MATSDRKRFAIAAIAAIAGVGFSPLVRAEPTPANRQRAELLFQTARETMDRGDFAAACPMLQESWQLDPGGGTMLALALCHEQEGKLATALREMREARTMATRASRADRVALAEDHVRILDRRASRIAVRASEDAAVVVDGARLSAAERTAGIAVDGGDHVVRVSMPGRQPWEARVLVAASGDMRLVEAPVPVREGRREDVPPKAARSMVPGLAIAGAGVAVLAAGVVFGVRALDRDRESHARCPSAGPCNDATGVELNSQARRDAWLADVAIPVGVVGIVVGVVMVVSARTARAPSTTSVGYSGSGGSAMIRF